MTSVTTQPRIEEYGFIVDPYNDDPESAARAEHNDSNVALAQRFEADVNLRPDAYRQALGILSQVALSGTLETTIKDGAQMATEGPLAAAAMLKAVLARRLDKVTFDDETETDLLQDAEQTSRLERHENATRQDLSAGIMRRKERAHPDGPRRRDIARIARLTRFVDRVAKWREQHPVEEQAAS